VITGDIGYRDTVVFTALGDTVNVTARLEELTKELECQVVLSDEVLKTAGLAPSGLPASEIVIRGHADPMTVRTVADAATLSAIFDTAVDAAIAEPQERLAPVGAA
jgi:adenylate cyclase